jgi:hypothetical protein
MSMQARPSIGFARGLRGDGSCFSKVIPRFRRKGAGWRPHSGASTPEGDVTALLRTAATADLFSRSAKGTAWRSKPGW